MPLRRLRAMQGTSEYMEIRAIVLVAVVADVELGLQGAEHQVRADHDGAPIL